MLTVLLFAVGCTTSTSEKGRQSFTPSAAETSAMVYWYWNDAAVSKPGITTDLEAMKEAGLEGAYLFFIRGKSDRVQFDNPAEQLSPEWWEMVKFAFLEARRLGLKLGLHSCDGFTVAGGPWISPEMSMQKVVWSDTLVSGGRFFSGKLPQPETIENYYRDIKTFAIPVFPENEKSSYRLNPKITSGLPGEDPQYLNDPAAPGRFRSEEPCWVQYAFDEPFTCRNVVIKKAGNIFQSNRLMIETGNDGEHFDFHTRLQPHRQGWMDSEADITFAIEPVTARYFRFVYDPGGTEPGAEDLDAAKWEQSLKIPGIELSSSPKINQYEGKSGLVWRIAERSDSMQLKPSDFIAEDKIIDISSFVNQKGELNWEVPEGTWKILRFGHTSTGKTNYIGGGAVGLECDKFNPAAARLQFDKWLGEFYRQVGRRETAEVLKYFHVDSWECGSQNWSPVFAAEFLERRGYDIKKYLPLFAGIPVNDAAFSENVLRDVRETISELVTDNFYGELHRLAAEKGLVFSAESVAPVLSADGMLHHKNVDIPMGEFWLNSPSHDKPNDVLDAVSAAHIYGKRLVQAESFTEIRIDWNEHPGMLKTLGDRNFALGINRFLFHVFSHNPWIDKKPGMTLGVVGLMYQPSQTWFRPGKAWVTYLENCQRQLQQGVPVTDIAVFTGEEIPRRAVLPDRLVTVFPGIFGEEIVLREKQRLANTGNPVHEQPRGVKVSKNMVNPADWVDPLRGYAYDSFNPDALLNLAFVENGKITLPSGASYALLAVPGKRRMNPNAEAMSTEVADKLLQLIKEGATVYFQEKPVRPVHTFTDENRFNRIVEEMFSGEFRELDSSGLKMKKLGKGRILTGKYTLPSFEAIGIEKDFFALEENGKQAGKLAWTHRAEKGKDLYFVANQEDNARTLELSFRVTGKEPVLFFPVSGETSACKVWRTEKGRTIIPYQFEANESVFVIFENRTMKTASGEGSNNPVFEEMRVLQGSWQLEFDPDFGGPEETVVMDVLSDWSENSDDRIKYYSGTVVYQKSFSWKGDKSNVFLDIGKVNNIAEIKVNGTDCGVAWTAPFRVEISKAIRQGDNQLEIAVTNTWANRLMSDHRLPEDEWVTWTTCAYRLEGEPLLTAGLMGPVRILKEK